MKKLLTILLIFVCIYAKSQEFDEIYIRNFISLNDSTVTNIATGDTLTTNEFVRGLLLNYATLDSLSYYSTSTDISQEISDSIGTYTFFSAGTDGQVPYMNPAGTDLLYSNNFKWNDTSLYLNYGTENLIVGKLAGDNANNTIAYSTFLGVASGFTAASGVNNTFIGYRSGFLMNGGNYNTYTGYQCTYSNVAGNYNSVFGSGGLYSNTSGSNNTAIGFNAGYSNTGSGNVFIGYRTGYNETGSNKLYIDNSNTTTPLIYGEFDKDYLKFNADSVRVTGDAYIDGNLTVGELLIHSKYETAAYTDPDSVITTSVTTDFKYLGDGQNNKCTNIYSEGFGLDGDTLLFTQAVYDNRDSIEFHIDYSCLTATSNVNKTISYGIMIKCVGGSFIEYRPTTKEVRTTTSNVYYSMACSTMPIFLKDGDKIWIVIKNLSSTSTVSTKNFGIYIREE